MIDHIDTLSEMYEVDTFEENFNDIIVINSSEELVSFALDILDFGDNINSEEELEHNNSYRILFSLLKKCLALTVAIERRYVDRTYRDSYYMHFSCKHGKYSRFCKRLFLFSGNVFDNETTEIFSELPIKKLQRRFIGTVVIRPLKEGKIGRTLMNPYFVMEERDVFLRYAKYSVTIYGMRLQINAFPFSMQDGETTTCAEITILNLISKR